MKNSPLLFSSKRTSNRAKRNAIFTLTFYRHQGQWVFDDERRDIFVEPLVCGADDVFDVISGRCDDDSINRCTVNFSSSPIPGFALHATLHRPGIRRQPIQTPPT